MSSMYMKRLNMGVDILWIGARTTANPFAVQEIADTLQGMDIPVLVKNPVNPDIDLWIGALERINQAGIKNWPQSTGAFQHSRNQDSEIIRSGRFLSR